VATTRFESSTGKIYRIRESVTVPGAKQTTGAELEPASVTATIYADKPGPDYNTGKTQLSIPGFKDTPRYNGFYATTDGISGGAAGPQPVVTDADAKKAEAEMQAELKNSLMSRLGASAPQGSVLVPDAVDISYGELTRESDADASKAVLSLSAQAAAPTINVSGLAAAIAAAGVPDFNNAPIGFLNPSALPIATDKMYTTGAQSITLGLTGPVTLIWEVDSDAIAKALAGKPKNQFDGIMAQFKPSISSAKSYVRPFFLPKFPGNPDKIHVEVAPAE
jgi:hypothetical protein